MRAVQLLRRLAGARSASTLGALGLRAAAPFAPVSTASLRALGAGAGPHVAGPLTPSLALRGFASSRYEDDDDEFFGEDEEDEDESFIQYPAPSARVRGLAPNFTADAVWNDEITQLSLSEFRGKYVVLFFYPKDFTYVCPTEIIAFNDRAAEFEALNAQLIAVSTDSAESHFAWTKLPRSKGGLGNMTIPLVADLTKLIAAKYGVLIEDEGIALRGLFIIDREGVVQQMTVNNLPIGRSVDEVLRLIKALQFNEEHGEVCPANWQPGDKTIIGDPKKSHKYFSTVPDDTEDGDHAGMTIVKTKSEFQQLVKSGASVVAKFEAPWCGKCTQIQPFVTELAGKHADVTFASLNVTLPEIEKLKEELNIEALPAFRFYKGGKEVGTPVAGYKKGPLKEAVEKLDN